MFLFSVWGTLRRPRRVLMDAILDGKSLPRVIKAIVQHRGSRIIEEFRLQDCFLGLDLNEIPGNRCVTKRDAVVGLETHLYPVILSSRLCNQEIAGSAATVPRNPHGPWRPTGPTRHEIDVAHHVGLAQHTGTCALKSSEIVLSDINETGLAKVTNLGYLHLRVPSCGVLASVHYSREPHACYAAL